MLLDIASTGLVTRAVVEKPVGHGFDEAAVAAGEKLEFEPATRGGKPIAVRIRFTYTFAPPPVGAVGARRDARRGAPAGGRDRRRARRGGHGAHGRDRRGRRVAGGRAVGRHLPRDDHRAPGRAPHEADETVQPGEEVTSVDRLALEAAPAPAAGHPGPPPRRWRTSKCGARSRRDRSPRRRSTSARSTASPAPTATRSARSRTCPASVGPPGLAGLLIVRGSAPQDSQYFVDGTPVPIVYHFGGLSSVVPTEMIDHLDFYPGNFSTQFGRAMGGVVDVGLAQSGERSAARHGRGRPHRLARHRPGADLRHRLALRHRRAALVRRPLARARAQGRQRPA